MFSLENIWLTQIVDTDLANIIQEETQLPSSIVNLLLSLNITSSEEAIRFLKPTLKQLHNPITVMDMEKAIIRIGEAIDKKEKILFHGDYDADGVTTIALAKRAFRLLGVEIDVFAPNRFDDGYGLNPRNMERFAQEYDLIITGDTGIRAFEGAKKVAESGKCDLIITDHHEPFVQSLDLLHEAPEFSVVKEVGKRYIALPDAYAVVDPHRIDDEHPCKTHAGVGVLFKTMLALFRHRNVSVQPLLNLLDLVATGTIADLAHQIDTSGDTMDFEVRVMCAAGLRIMNENPSTWVRAIKEACGLSEEYVVTSETIGFTIGPTLNAVGRLYDPMPAVEVLLEDDYALAKEQALELREINQERQTQTKAAYQIIDELRENGDETKYDYGIVVHSELYGEGIAGLVAGKLQTSFYRPAIALTTAEKDGQVVYKGSARSIPGVHILHMLDEVQREIGPFIYGGHEQAAGMTIKPEQFTAFQQAFRKACMVHEEEVFTPTFYYQTEVPIEEIDDNFMSLINQFEPFGEGNKKPLFRLSNALVIELKPHKNGKGFNLQLKQGNRTVKGLSFDLAESFIPKYTEELAAKKEAHVDILFKPNYNEYPEGSGRISIQLNIEDIKISSN